MAQKVRVSVVVAIGAGKIHNRVIGKDNKLLWHIPEDLKRFKAITLGHPIVMGRKTFESIVAVLGKPLPGRTNIVITRDTAWAYPGVEVVHSLEEGLEKAKSLDSEEIFLGGGGQIYEQAFPQIDRIYLTLIEDDQEGDSYFPDYSEFTKVLHEEKHEYNGLKYTWINLERESQ